MGLSPPPGRNVRYDCAVELFDELRRLDRQLPDRRHGATVRSWAHRQRIAARWIRRALRTELHLRARDTPAGWVIDRVDEALSEDEAFVRTADGWALAGDERSGGWNGDRTRLIEAAWSVETRTIRHDPDAEKLQLAWRDDTRAVCKAVLAESGTFAKVVLGEVVAQRFNASFESSVGYLDLDARREDDEGELPGTGAQDPASGKGPPQNYSVVVTGG